MERIVALVAGGDQQDDAEPGDAGTGEGEDGPPALGKIKEAPGNISLETMLTETDKLLAVRAIGLPPDRFTDVAPKVEAGRRARAEKKVTKQLVNAFKKVSGKENILFKLAEASVGEPEGIEGVYTNHYRRGLIKLLDVLEFRSSNYTHQR
ncbi:hypothetical protein [Streptomyces sp. bgisy029]|uniref:hypothetical protein n=1 Tax=Streptomyces sp. bgisy029 TaxID=3413771 RepID=UPI003D7077DF